MAGCNHCLLWIQKPCAFGDLDKSIGSVEEVEFDKRYPPVKFILLLVEGVYFLLWVFDLGMY
jgi:hypothetical protein